MAFIWKNYEIEVRYWDGNIWINDIVELICNNKEDEINVKGIASDIKFLNDLETELSRYLYNMDNLPNIGLLIEIDHSDPSVVSKIEVYKNKILIDFESGL